MNKDMITKLSRKMKYYIAAWLIAFVVLHIIMFILPDALISPKDGVFWVIYITLMISLIIQGACTLYYAGKEKKQERYLYIPIVLLSYIALLTTMLLALQALELGFLPTWFTIIVAVLVLAFYTLSILQTLTAADMIVETDNRIERQTSLFRSLTAQAHALEQTAPVQLRSQTKKVYEAFRYSDPVSTQMSAPLEAEIQNVYNSFAISVKQNLTDKAGKEAEQLCILIKERNELCRQSKKN